MKRKIFVIGFIFLVLVNIAAISRIGYHKIENYCKVKNSEYCQRQHFLQQKLQLTENQTEEMQLLIQNLRSHVDSIKTSLQKSQKELIGLFHEVDVDTLRLKKISNEIDLLQSEMKNKVIDYILAQKKVLSSEQQTLFVDLLSQYLLPEQACHLSDSLLSK